MTIGKATGSDAVFMLHHDAVIDAENQAEIVRCLPSYSTGPKSRFGQIPAISLAICGNLLEF